MQKKNSSDNIQAESTYTKGRRSSSDMMMMKKSKSLDNLQKNASNFKRVPSIDGIKKATSNKISDMNTFQKLAVTNCPGIVYDILKSDPKTLENHDKIGNAVVEHGQILHVVQDHIATTLISTLTEHIMHLWCFYYYS